VYGLVLAKVQFPRRPTLFIHPLILIYAILPLKDSSKYSRRSWKPNPSCRLFVRWRTARCSVVQLQNVLQIDHWRHRYFDFMPRPVCLIYPTEVAVLDSDWTTCITMTMTWFYRVGLTFADLRFVSKLSVQMLREQSCTYQNYCALTSKLGFLYCVETLDMFKDTDCQTASGG